MPRPSRRWSVWIAGAFCLIGLLIWMATRTPGPPATPPAGGEPAEHLSETETPPPVASPGPRPAEAPPAGPAQPPGAGPVDDLPADHPALPAKAAGPESTLQWLGESCFYIHSPAGNTLVIDPFDGRRAGRSDPDIGAHLLAVSREAPAHNNRKAVHPFEGEKLVEASSQTVTRGDLRVTPVPLPGGKAFLVQAGDLRILHLGSPTAIPSPEQLAKSAGDLHVLLVPVDGRLPPAAASAAAKALSPRLIVPMGYEGGGQSGSSKEVDRFIAATPYAVTREQTDVLLLTPKTLPPQPEIWLLQPRG